MTAVEPDSPAGRAGLAAGDIIVALDGHTVTGVDDLLRLLTGERIGRTCVVEALRAGRLRSFSLAPAERRRG